MWQEDRSAALPCNSAFFTIAVILDGGVSDNELPGVVVKAGNTSFAAYVEGQAELKQHSVPHRFVTTR